MAAKDSLGMGKSSFRIILFTKKPCLVYTRLPGSEAVVGAGCNFAVMSLTGGLGGL